MRGSSRDQAPKKNVEKKQTPIRKSPPHKSLKTSHSEEDHLKGGKPAGVKVKTRASKSRGGKIPPKTESNTLIKNPAWNEQLYQSLVDAAQDAIFVIDRDDRILYANSTAHRFFNVREGELIGRVRSKLFPDEIATRQQVSIEQVFKTGKTFTSESKLPYPGGEKWTSTVLSPVHDADGQITAVMGIARDIGNIKQAEDALRASEERFRALTEKTTEGIGLIDASGICIYQSPAAESIFGLPINQLIGKNMFDLLHPDDLESAKVLFADLLQQPGKSVSGVYRFRHMDQTWLWVEASGTNLLHDPSVEAIVVNYRDVTERRRTEETMRDNEERFRATFEQAATGFSHTTLDGHFLRVNRKLCEITGYTREELLDRTFLDITHPDDKQLQVPYLEQLLIGNIDTFTIEKRYVRKDGNPLWVEVTVSLVRNTSGAPQYLIAITQDIHGRKGIEADLNKSEERYRALIRNLPGLAYRCRNDVDWTMEFISDGCKDLTGYPAEDFIGNQGINYEELINPADRSRVRDEIGAAIAKGEAYELAYRILRADREERWVWERGRAVEPNGEGHEMLEGFVTDITDLVKRQRALETLHAGGLTLSKSLDPNEIGRGIIRVLEERLDWHHAAVRVRRNGSEEIELLAFSEPHSHSTDEATKEELARSKISRLGEGMSGWVIEHGETIRSGNLSEDPRYIAVYQNMASGLYVPIKSADRTLGCISVEDERPNAFSEEDERLLITLANQAAVAIENARLFVEAKSRADEFAILYETTRDISSHQDARQVLQTVVERATRLMHVPVGGIYLHDPMRNELEVAVNVGLLSSLGMRLTVGEGVAGRVAQTREPMIVDDYQTWQGRSLKYEGVPFRAVLQVPMIYSGELVGVLTVSEIGDSERKFTEADVRLLTLFASTAAGTVYSARLFDQLQQRLQQLSALHSIDMVISASTDLRVNLKVILETARRQLKADAVSVLLLNPVTLNLEYATGLGFETHEITKTFIRIGEESVGHIALSKETLVLPNLSIAGRDFSRQKMVELERFESYVGVPLVAKGQIKGVLEVYQRAPFEINGDWMAFLNLLSGQTAIAVDNSLLFENLERVNAELMLAYDATIEGWSQALELRDRETQGHSRRVLEWTLSLAREMGVHERDIQHIRRGTLLHDIGKMGIPDEILRKSSSLSEEEWAIMRRHPQYAYDLLSPIIYLRPAIDIPYCHHEKWDGTGYPRRLKGEEIPLAARIFAVVDVYDALTSDRPYRKAWPQEEALEYIQSQAGQHFDPGIVDAFLQMIKLEIIRA